MVVPAVRGAQVCLGRRGILRCDANKAALLCSDHGLVTTMNTQVPVDRQGVRPNRGSAVAEAHGNLRHRHALCQALEHGHLSGGEVRGRRLRPSMPIGVLRAAEPSGRIDGERRGDLVQAGQDLKPWQGRRQADGQGAHGRNLPTEGNSRQLARVRPGGFHAGLADVVRCDHQASVLRDIQRRQTHR